MMVVHGAEALSDLSVRDIEEVLKEVLQEVAVEELGREMHAFPHRRVSAHAIM